jgi:hypothetical protein
MAKKPEPPKPISWDIYRALPSNRLVGMLMGTVEAADESVIAVAAHRAIQL